MAAAGEDVAAPVVAESPTAAEASKASNGNGAATLSNGSSILTPSRMGLSFAPRSHLPSRPASGSMMLGERHDLEHQWCLGCTISGNKKDQWQAAQRVVHEVSTIEEFWGMQNALLPIGETKSDVFFFKKGKLPAWEDTAFAAGGRWVVQLPDHGSGGKIEQAWQDVLVRLIADSFHSVGGDSVMGAAYQSKKRGRFCVWTCVSDKEAVEEIGRFLRDQVVNIAGAEYMFESFKDKGKLRLTETGSEEVAASGAIPSREGC